VLLIQSLFQVQWPGHGGCLDDREKAQWDAALERDKKRPLASGSKDTPRRIFRRWLNAAKKGHPGAQYEVGKLYENGEGVRKNYVRAYLWYTLAAKQGVQEAQVSLENLTPKMMPSSWERRKKESKNGKRAIPLKK